jgi:putative protease
VLPLAIGDCIIIKGPSTDFEQIVNSMQIEYKEIQRAEGGQSIGLKVLQPTKEKDVVFKKL